MATKYSCVPLGLPPRDDSRSYWRKGNTTSFQSGWVPSSKLPLIFRDPKHPHGSPVKSRDIRWSCHKQRPESRHNRLRRTIWDGVIHLRVIDILLVFKATRLDWRQREVLLSDWWLPTRTGGIRTGTEERQQPSQSLCTPQTPSPWGNELCLPLQSVPWAQPGLQHRKGPP